MTESISLAWEEYRELGRRVLSLREREMVLVGFVGVVSVKTWL